MLYQSKRLKITLLAGLFSGLFSLISGQAHGAYRIGDDESYVKIGGLLQVQGLLEEDGAPDGSSVGKELFVRRMRLMFYGQINKWVNFFIETDNPNFGKYGNFSGNTFIQDAYLELNLHPMIQVDIGMLLVPFSHMGMQGATSLLGVDYRSALVRYPSGSNKVWRDFGVMFRGMFTKWLEYRLGVFNGVRGGAGLTVPGAPGDPDLEFLDPRNDTDAPRFVGRLTFNIFEPEGGAGVGGMFYDGIYLKKTEVGVVSTKRVLSIGGSVDFQPNVNAVMNATGDADSRSPYVAAAGDVFWDLPFGAENIMSVNGQVNFYYYNYGDVSDPMNFVNFRGDAGASLTGFGISSELGWRYDAFQPLVLFDYYNATDFTDSTGDMVGIYGGFNYWMFAHATSFKLQVGAHRVADEGFGVSAVLQAQLLF